MLIGQDRAGKTSLKKSLKGVCFDPEEDSTVGIEVDPSLFKVTTETWRTGTTENDQNVEEAISFDYHTAMWMVDNLKERRSSTQVETDTEENETTLDSEITELPSEPRPTEQLSDSEKAEISSEPRAMSSRDGPQVSPGPLELNQGDDFDSPAPCVPEEVAMVTETLLQGGWEDNREDVYSTLWDFAGQSVYYVTHPLFLTAQAIYCLVYDLSLNPHDTAKSLVKQGVHKKFQDSFNLKTNLDYLDFWMMSVACLATSQNGDIDECPKSEELPDKLPLVFLVCTHADTPYDNRDPSELAQEILGCLMDKPYGAHLYDVFVVDNTKSATGSECSEVMRLREEVLTVAKKLPHINAFIPIKWLKFDNALSTVKEKGQAFISLESAKYIASKACNIDKDEEFETLINYLHDLRRLIHFDDSPDLNNLVVLDPQWLIDVFKNVITVRPYSRSEKRFVELWYKLEREGILDQELLSHVWGTLYDNKESCESLVRIMQKFSLLCPWPLETSKSYLVPSMLKTHPSSKIISLVASAKTPSLFITFETAQVPPGFFHRFVLQFYQFGKEAFLRPIKPQLFQNFARFFTSGNDAGSVIFACNALTIEVVIHTEDHHDTASFCCARVVRRQVGLMLQRMRNEFFWLRNMKCEMSVLCPVCCPDGTIDACYLHEKEGCRKEQCLHFWSLSELCRAKQTIICPKSASAQKVTVDVKQFLPWYSPAGDQVNIIPLINEINLWV